MEIIIDNRNELKKSFNVAGNDRNWRDRIKKLCRARGWSAEDYVKAAAAFYHNTLGKGRLKSLANRIWRAFENRTSPSVAEWLRRLTCHFEALIRKGKELPVAT